MEEKMTCLACDRIQQIHTCPPGAPNRRVYANVTRHTHPPDPHPRRVHANATCQANPQPIPGSDAYDYR